MQQILRRSRDGARARRHFLFSPSFPLSSLSSPAILYKSRWSAQQERKAQAREGRASLGCACELEGGG